MQYAHYIPRKKIILVVIIVIVNSYIIKCEPVPSACELTSICKCQQLKLICSCTNASKKLLEIKQDGYGYIPEGIVKINVDSCNDVYIFQQSLEKVRSLRQIRLENIKTLSLHEKSFSWKHNVIDTRESRIDSSPGINIEIVNSFIPRIPNYAFEGHIDSIHIENTKINSVDAFAFSSLDPLEIFKMTNCKIENFQQHSFKKFIVNHFIIEGGNIGVMNSYTVRDLIVRNDMRFQGINFGLVKTLSVQVEGPSAFKIQECVFEMLESEAFRINTRGPVFIDDNIVRDLRVGAFIGITVDPAFQAHNDKQELVFENNTLTKVNTGAIIFNTTGLKPRIDRLILNTKCSCSDIKNYQTKLVKYQGNDIVTPDVSKQTWCYDGTQQVTISQYNDKKCKMNRTTLYIIIGLSIGVIILIGLCLGGFIFYKKWKKMYKEVKTTRDIINENRLSTYSNSSNHVIVLPPPKTYLETEIDDFNEEVTPLKSQNDLNNLKETGL